MIPRGRSGAIVLVLMLASGCHLLLPFASPDQGAGAESRRPDGLALDRAPVEEQRTSDIGRPWEARIVDGSKPPPKPDAPAGLDVGPVSDGGGLLGGCSSPQDELQGGMGGIAFCLAPTLVTQAGAAPLCNINAGWRLCPASIYRSIFHGTGAKPPLGNLWIAGCCAVTATKVDPPVDQACSCSPSSMVSGPQASISCTLPGPIDAQDKCLGVVTAVTCNKIGSPAMQTGYWTVQPAHSFQAGAVCCK
jgi:hypothetical protein